MQTQTLPVLEAKLTDVRHFSSVLRCLAFTPRASIQCSNAGLVVIVEEARVLQAKAYIPYHIFSSYQYNPPPPDPNRAPAPRRGNNGDDLEEEEEEDELDGYDIEGSSFEISIHHLLDCLGIFGNASSLASLAPSSTNEGAFGTGSSGGGGGRKRGRWDDDGEDGFGGDESRHFGRGKGGKDRAETKATAGTITWKGAGEPLEIWLMEEGGGPTTTCNLSTSPATTEMDLDVAMDPTPDLRIAMLSSYMYNALSSLDPSSDRVTFSSLDPASPLADGAPSPGGTPSSTLTPRRSTGSSGRKKSKEEESVDFRIEADGTWGTVQMNFKNVRPMIHVFDRQTSISHSYRKTLLLKTLRALSFSSQTSLELFSSGLLILQTIHRNQNASDSRSSQYEDLRLIRDPVEREEKRAALKAKEEAGMRNDGILSFSMMSLEDVIDDY